MNRLQWSLQSLCLCSCCYSSLTQGQNLAPIYEELADAYSHTDHVVIAKVDADAEKALGYAYRCKTYSRVRLDFLQSEVRRDGFPQYGSLSLCSVRH